MSERSRIRRIKLLRPIGAALIWGGLLWLVVNELLPTTEPPPPWSLGDALMGLGAIVAGVVLLVLNPSAKD